VHKSGRRKAKIKNAIRLRPMNYAVTLRESKITSAFSKLTADKKQNSKMPTSTGSVGSNKNLRTEKMWLEG
jgi:hypothetical protein